MTLKEDVSADVLKQMFQPYGLKSVQKLSGGRYLVIVVQDPGPEVITKQAEISSDIEAVQPNYVYRAMPSPTNESR